MPSGLAPLTDTFSAVVPATAAGADFEVTVCVAPYAGTVTAVNYVADTTLTGANTDSRTLSLINKGAAGSGTTEVAAKAFVSGVNGAAFDATAITLSATAANLAVAAGDVLAFKSLHVGSTGLADPGGTVFVTISRD
jgi:hypothetical protein